MNVKDEILPALETKCDHCDGEGGSHDSYEARWINCSSCKGAGYIVTPLGAQILSLMQHNFGHILQSFHGERN
jgi:DnaJ-class molecular chaperone